MVPVFIRRAVVSDQSGELQPIDTCRPIRLVLEVTLQQTFQTAAVTGLVAGHLMDGVVGCVAPQH